MFRLRTSARTPQTPITSQTLSTCGRFPENYWGHWVIMAVVRICETGMPNFAPLYRRQDYPLMREIMDDGETLPLSFDEWRSKPGDPLTA